MVAESRHAHPLLADGYERIPGDALAARAKQIEPDTWRLVEADGRYLGHAIRYDDRRSLALEVWPEDGQHAFTYDLENSAALTLGAAAFALRRHRHQLKLRLVKSPD